MVFTSDMVHILLGYPMQSPDDLLIALLAFYLQMPKGMSDNVIHKDALKAIVKSDMLSIGGSMGSTIVSVGPLPSTTKRPELKGEKENEGSDEFKPKSTKTFIGASVGGVLFLVVVIFLVVGYRKSNG